MVAGFIGSVLDPVVETAVDNGDNCSDADPSGLTCEVADPKRSFALLSLVRLFPEKYAGIRMGCARRGPAE